MRKIKFDLIHPVTFAHCGDYGLEDGASIEYLIIAGYIARQYTGVRDKNGDYIYEGDILKIDYYGDEYITHVRDYKGTLVVGVVEDEEYEYTPLGWLDQDDLEVEVIGNIYANPELLENK